MKGKILVELQGSFGSDKEIAMSAWTSTYDKDRMESKYNDQEKIAALVPRLIRDGHATPIESVIFRFWMRHPIFVDRQLMTHRLQSSSGLSGRYRTLPDDWFSIPADCVEIMNRSSENQNWGKVVSDDFDLLCSRANLFYKGQLELLKNAEKAEKITNAEYKRVREVLRGVLPTAGMVERTSIFNLRSLSNFFKLRLSSHAQPEIRELASLMLEEVKKSGTAPLAIATLEEMEWKI